MDPDGTKSYFSAQPHAGRVYLDVISTVHSILCPKSYLEIGTQTGNTLALAKCASIAVDPNFQLESNVVGEKPVCSLFQMGSDDFFEKHNPTMIFGRNIDLAFLDGMHLYEFLLRDFINIEKHCRPNSVVILHDCIPTDTFAARRRIADISQRELTPNPHAWAGDVWKTVAILMRIRPDLAIHAFDAPPTGLVLITNLDPTSTILSRKYTNLVREFRDPEPIVTFEDYLVSLHIRGTSSLVTREDFAELFWL